MYKTNCTGPLGISKSGKIGAKERKTSRKYFFPVTAYQIPTKKRINPKNVNTWLIKSVDPKALQESGHNLERFGKYTFADLNHAPPKDHPEKKSLILAPTWMGSTTLKEIGDIYMSNHDVAFRVYEY